VKLNKDQRKVLDDSVRDDKEKGREQTFAEPDVDDLVDVACPTCEGTRLNATARAVKFAGVGITDIARLSVTEIRKWVEKLAMSGRDADIARDLLPEIKSRLEFLEQVGLNYLTLDRGAPRSVAARRNAFAWPRSWAATCRAFAMCWTSPRLVCMRVTTKSC
jgi:excinuclease ABC subunit A